MRVPLRVATALWVALSLTPAVVAVPPPGDPVPKEPSTDPGCGNSETNPITYRGLEKPFVLYLSFYDYEPPRIPVGLTRGE